VALLRLLLGSLALGGLLQLTTPLLPTDAQRLLPLALQPRASACDHRSLTAQARSLLPELRAPGLQPLLAPSLSASRLAPLGARGVDLRRRVSHGLRGVVIRAAATQSRGGECERECAPRSQTKLCPLQWSYHDCVTLVS
jgi:hypothetical protein